jgi:hypothetical protein
MPPPQETIGTIEVPSTRTTLGRRGRAKLNIRIILEAPRNGGPISSAHKANGAALQRFIQGQQRASRRRVHIHMF